MNLTEHLERQQKFSFNTFGPPRNGPSGQPTDGVIDHLEKELVEVRKDPTDIFEWIDVAILAFDGALRAGFSPGQIVDALAAKQTTNEQRKWPDWRTATPGKAIEHVRTPASNEETVR